MTEVIRAAAEIQAVCEAQQWRYCIIDGLALQRWGEPRETVDVDLTLLTGFGGEERFIEILLERFEARVENAADFAMTRRVLLLRAKSGVGLDIALGALPFEESAVARSSVFAFPDDALLRTCSAEDLIVMKAFAARAKDWLDVEGIITRQTGKFDWSYILAHLKPLAELKQAPEILDELEKRRIDFEKLLRRRFHSPAPRESATPLAMPAGEQRIPVFLSYARGDDETFVARLHADLTTRGSSPEKRSSQHEEAHFKFEFLISDFGIGQSLVIEQELYFHT